MGGPEAGSDTVAGCGHCIDPKPQTLQNIAIVIICPGTKRDCKLSFPKVGARCLGSLAEIADEGDGRLGLYSKKRAQQQNAEDEQGSAQEKIKKSGGGAIIIIIHNIPPTPAAIVDFEL